MRSETVKAAWSDPYLGVQHLDEQPKSAGRWATVTDRNSFAELTGWYPGCGFEPYRAMFDTVEAARAAGEAWVANGAWVALTELEAA